MVAQAGTGEGVDCNIRLVSPGCPGPFNVDAKNLKDRFRFRILKGHQVENLLRHRELNPTAYYGLGLVAMAFIGWAASGYPGLAMTFSQCGNMVIANGPEENASRAKVVKDQVASLIAPGGIFAQDDADSVPVPRRRDRPKDTTYSEAFPGIIPAPEQGGFGALQAPILQGRRSIRQPEVRPLDTLE
eukprot:symbB.v1.2.015965.t1/scaffold1205.1/size131557/4